jgi:hypothetical protein
MVENGIISTMGLNIKNEVVEQLVNEVALKLGVSKTEAVRQALLDKAKILGLMDKEKRHSRLREYLDELHAKNPDLKNMKVTKEDYDALYDYL